jgi:hypothetical protein
MLFLSRLRSCLGTQKAHDDNVTGRRNFLSLAGAAAPAIMIGATVGTPSKASADPVNLGSSVMQDTDHTRAYFNSARF